MSALRDSASWLEGRGGYKKKTASEICLILSILRKLNSITVLLLMQNISTFLTNLTPCRLMARPFLYHHITIFSARRENVVNWSPKHWISLKTTVYCPIRITMFSTVLINQASNCFRFPLKVRVIESRLYHQINGILHASSKFGQRSLVLKN